LCGNVTLTIEHIMFSYNEIMIPTFITTIY